MPGLGRDGEGKDIPDNLVVFTCSPDDCVRENYHPVEGHEIA